MTQPLLAFDAELGELEKQRGMELAAKRRALVLEAARKALVLMALERPDRCANADDAQAFLVRNEFEESALGNAAGSLFRTGEWEPVGWIESTRSSNHKRPVRIWRLK